MAVAWETVVAAVVRVVAQAAAAQYPTPTSANRLQRAKSNEKNDAAMCVPANPTTNYSTQNANFNKVIESRKRITIMVFSSS